MANERRLIDANNLYTSYCWTFEGIVPEAEMDRVAYATAAQPTVDAVEVVRCRDCKYYYYHGKTSILVDGKNIKCGWCQRRTRYDEEFRMLPDDFCSYGEKGGTQPQREDV